MKTASLYFVALIPPEPLKSIVTGLKMNFAHSFHSAHALRSPPHITLLPPFRAADNNLELIEKVLTAVCGETDAFSISIDGFGCFKPRVIYLRPVINQAFESLHRRLSENATTYIGNIVKGSGRPFHPHITLAFKDLKPEMFRKGWVEYKHKSFLAEMSVEGLWLLKHDGKKWQEYKYFHFEGKSLP